MMNQVIEHFLTYTFPQTFDVIYSLLTFMHIEVKQMVLNKAAGLLKDGERFVLSMDKDQERFIDIKSGKVPVFYLPMFTWDIRMDWKII